MQGIEQLEKFQEFVSDIGGLGRYEDTYIVHAAEGETVVPMEVLDKNPVLKNRLFETMRDMGIQPERYVVGSEFNSINPLTGQPEFFLKKVFRRLRKAKQDIGRRLRKFAADSSGYVAPIVGAMYGPLAGSLAGGILGQYKRENPGDKNQALQMALRGGISGLTSNLAQGQNLLTGRGMSQAYGTADPLAIGKEMLGIRKPEVANTGDGLFSTPEAALENAMADGQTFAFDTSGGERLMNASLNTPTGVATDAVGTVVKELPKEGFLESFGMEGSRAGLNPFNILKNPTPNQIREMANYQRLIQGGTDPATALSTIQEMFQLTPAKASAIAGAVTYGAQIIADRMSGEDDDDDTTTAEIGRASCRERV